MDIPNLQQKLSYEVHQNQVKIVKSLKFQNLMYQVGDNIKMRSDINSQEDLYAKILIIIQAKNITPFPLVYVAWYEESGNEMLTNLLPGDLSIKELILTEDKDWQYIEAVKGKIEIITEKEFMHKDPKEQQDKELFFCRSYLTKQKQIVVDSRKHCYCQKLYKPENPLVMCQICNVLFHPACSRGRDDRCIRCLC